MRHETRSKITDQRSAIQEPEYRALEQIVAEAEAAGVPVLRLGPAGILEIDSPRPIDAIGGGGGCARKAQNEGDLERAVAGRLNGPDGHSRKTNYSF